MLFRERRSWTATEDQLLRNAVAKGQQYLLCYPPPLLTVSQRIPTTKILPNGMPLLSMSPTAQTRTAANAGLPKWLPMLLKVAGHQRKTNASSRASSIMVQGMTILILVQQVIDFLFLGGRLLPLLSNQEIVIVRALSSAIYILTDCSLQSVLSDGLILSTLPLIERLGPPKL